MIRKLIVVLMLLQLISCSKDEIVNEEPDNHQPATLNITVDERMELLSVIQHFTTWANKRHTKFNLDYKDEIDEYFEPYSNHEAVQLCQEMVNNGFTYDAPPTFVLCHSNLPEFSQEHSYPGHIVNRAGSRYKLVEFANAMRDFSVESNFQDFFDNHQSNYNEIVEDIESNLGESNYTELMEDYYGNCKEGYTLIIAPLFHAGGYASTIYSDKGELVFSIQGPLESENGKPVFGGLDWFEYVALHEFSHSFVNPLSQLYYSSVIQYQHLYESIAEEMKAMAYNNWIACVNEHLVRVNVARFALQLKDEEAKDEILKSEYDKGFRYIYELDEVMNLYEQNRETYNSYQDYYFEILDCFGRISN